VTWYLDAIDPRGGRAIAAQRKANLSASSSLDENTPVAFIGGPLFEPQVVSSRAAGFAMARGRAQFGLHANGEEVAFDSVAAVAEFVRRTYVRGSGGDGSGENGVPPLPLAPDEDDGGFDAEALPRLESNPEIDLIARILAHSNRFLSVSGSLKPGASVMSVPLAGAGRAPSAYGFGIGRLVRGAVRMLREVVRRCPSKSGTMEYLGWCETFDRALYVVTAMDLWGRLPRHLSAGFNGVRQWLFDAPPDRLPLRYRWLIRQLVRGDFRRGSPLPLQWNGFRFFPETYDPVSDLARIPVAKKFIPDVSTDARNLLAVLSVVTATPADLLLHDPKAASVQAVMEARAELALLAAAYLNLGTERQSANWGDATSDLFLARLVSTAESWLSANCPKRVFAIAVEKMICTCSTLPA